MRDIDHFDGDSTVLGFVEGTAGVAVEGRLEESLSQSHKDAEKSSCPPRCRRPLRLVFSFASFAPAHVALRAAFSRLPSQRPLACVQHFSIFLRASCMPDSNASLPTRIPAWI